MSSPHISVLLDPILECFAKKSLNIFVDATLGAGGHAAAILEAHSELKRFIGIDQDPEALTIAGKRLAPWRDKVELFRGNYSERIADLPDNIDGVLMDLGVSSMQLDRPEKGFSFMNDGPLDMRMDPSNPLSAEVVVNTWPEKDLARIIRDYGEEKRWRQAARAIVNGRKEKPITTTRQLVDLLRPVLYNPKKSIHPVTLVFQALRICVNDELGVLERSLPKLVDHLAPGGLLAVITFHSLEDRIVKNFFRFEASDKYDTSGIAGVFRDKEPRVLPVTRKPITANEQEIAENPRSRSAKLRIVEKL
ncbi:MAG: 16S rRNA (cytosine(1402)-N(4))-methyltransferase RsmH [Chlamydiales bacterium]|nr:16S rRNA (cytosine(1402)-N(4))-methyltransferase RsmH [Chlamydiia bacterium]MCP5508521.1 16S rRNA (cytosine(1402)-N(4))-methyltransferase RsmH [Chlamydiales bacterium]